MIKNTILSTILVQSVALGYAGNLAVDKDLRSSKSIVIDLSYNDEYQPVYTLPAYFGSDRQGGSGSSFVLDTTSPYVAITGRFCDNCHGVFGRGVFDTRSSKTFHSVSDPDDPITVYSVHTDW